MKIHLQFRTLGFWLNILHTWVIQLSGLQRPRWTQINLTLKQILPSPPDTSRRAADSKPVHKIISRRDRLWHWGKVQRRWNKKKCWETNIVTWVFVSQSRLKNRKTLGALCIHTAPKSTHPLNTAMNYNSWYLLKLAGFTANLLMSYNHRYWEGNFHNICR